jgi:hypothetical protein
LWSKGKTLSCNSMLFLKYSVSIITCLFFAVLV